MVKEVTIQFTHSGMINTYGVRPIKMPVELAQKYLDKRWAKLLEAHDTVDRPAPHEEALPKIPKVQVEPPSNQMVEEDTALTKVTWVASSPPPPNYIDAGKTMGFGTYIMTPNSINPSKLLKSDFIVVSPSLKNFEEHEKRQIKNTLFQERQPYILWVDEQLLLDSSPSIRQMIQFCKGMVFSDGDFIEDYIDKYGDALEDWITAQKPEELWRYINKSVKDIL